MLGPMLGDENIARQQVPGRAPGSVLAIVGVLALGVVCGVAGALLWSRNTTRPVSAPATPWPVIAPAPTAAAPAIPLLRRVAIQEVNGRVQVALALDQVVPSDAHRLNNPDRVYVDLHGLRIAPELSHTMEVNAGGIQRIRIAQTRDDTVRVVLDLNSSFRYTVAPQNDPPRLLVELMPGKTGGQAKLETAKPAVQ